MSDGENETGLDDVAEYYRAGWEQVLRLATSDGGSRPSVVFGQPDLRRGYLEPPDAALNAHQ